MKPTLRRLILAAAGLAALAPMLAMTPAGSAPAEPLTSLFIEPRALNVGIIIAPTSETTNASRINNGTEDSGNAFPYVVRLEGLGASCSGIMITPRWVLTAAHCLWGHSGATACGDPVEAFVKSAPGWIPSGWNPDVGADVTLVSPTLDPPPKVNIMESIGGTLNACTENSRSRDWALLHLDRRVAFSETNRFHPPVIQGKPTCLMDGEFRGVIAGYGPTSVFSTSGGVKHFGYEDEWERDPTDTGAEYWNAWFVPFPGATPETQVITILALLDEIYDGMNAGDSGGPLLQVNEQDQPIALCGVASSPFITPVPLVGVDIGNGYAAVDTQEAVQFIGARILASFPENPLIDGWYEGECRPPNENADADSDSDGIPDACDNCPLIANSDQGNFDFQNDGLGDLCDDSDNDGLSDHAELNIFGTDPLNEDTDDDGLTDGAEVNEHKTNPLDSDTDDDELDDGLEVAYGTDPLDADTDNDGLPDGQDVDFVKNAVSGLPPTAFNPPGEGTQNAILVQLDSIESLLLAGKIEQAISRLTTLRGHLDGCGTVPGTDDWIVTCPEQIKIRELVDLLIANLSN